MSGSWLDALQPASWRGVPFSVLSSEIQAGRKTAVHQYPFRDTVWVEDLGKKGRVYSFRGFLVGDDCYDQEDRMLGATEMPGSGELVHPSLGSLTVSLVEFTSAQEQERGRSVSLNFRFIDGSSPLYPGIDTATGNAVDSAANTTDSAAVGDYDMGVFFDVFAGASVLQGLAQTAQGFVDMALAAVADAGLLANAVAGLRPPTRHHIRPVCGRCPGRSPDGSHDGCPSNCQRDGFQGCSGCGGDATDGGCAGQPWQCACGRTSACASGSQFGH